MQRGSQDIRVVNAKMGGRLEDLLRPDDKILEVVRYENYYMGGHDDPLTELRFLTRHSEAVVTLTALATDSRLTNDGDWIESTMRGEVIDVLKNTGVFQVSPGTLLSLPYDGGEVTIDERTVRARSIPTDLPQPGRRYLYFLFESAASCSRCLQFIHSSCEGNPFAD